jgi:hypothetical protein
MALKPQLSFSSGELDPIMHDRVTLERFQNAVATARNVMIGKSGTVMSRFGRFFFKNAANSGQIRVYSPPRSGKFLEFGIDSGSESYVRLYDISGTLLKEFKLATYPAVNFREADIPLLHFASNGDYVYVFKGRYSFSENYNVFRIKITSTYDAEIGLTALDVVTLPFPTGSSTFTSVASGYNVDMAWSVVYKGQELRASNVGVINTPAVKKPIAPTEKLDMNICITSDVSLLGDISEVRIYQRPAGGSSYGYIGRSTSLDTTAGNIWCKFTDIGGEPDFSNTIPTLITADMSPVSTVGGHSIATGTFYQQRLLLGDLTTLNREAIITSRPGFHDNFFRDYPYSADSALNFKAGADGNARVLRMVESDGLVVFTSAGVFVSVGVLTPENCVLQKRGGWIIDENIPPLVVPGGLFFVDKSTSTVRQLVYSQEIASYDSSDQSIFSDHLFKKRTITSWAFQEGTTPIIIVTFSDGTFATFTYNFEHQMKAWTRHDTIYPVEQVESTGISDTTIFVINKDGQRQIEMTIPRTIPPAVYAANPEAEKLAYSAFMDGVKVKVELLNDDLVGAGNQFVIHPVTTDDWTDTNLVLSCLGLFTVSGAGTIGSVYRFFHPIDKSVIDLRVTSRVSDNVVIVEATDEWPEEYSSGFRLYKTHTTVTGLDHLGYEDVSVMCDGDIISSPYNDVDGDTVLSVPGFGPSAGILTLPERSAITIVGRPIVADIKTLNISTLEQSPTMIESLSVNKLYMRVFESRGLYVDNQFPEEKEGEVDGTSVEGMQSLDDYDVPSGSPIIGNRSKPKSSKRHEITLPGSWESQGQIAIRQVDPLHFEILSIVADVEVLKRSDR